MTLEEGKELVRNAIRAGIFNDLGSGGNVDICVITQEGAKHLREYEVPTQRPHMDEALRPKFKKNTTPFLLEKIEEIKPRLEYTQDVEMVEAS